MIVAITTIGVQMGEMRSSTAAALVGAGMISVILFPMFGLALAPKDEPVPAPPPPTPNPAVEP